MFYYLSKLDKNKDWNNLRKEVMAYFRTKAYKLAVKVESIRLVTSLFGSLISMQFFYYWNGLSSVHLHLMFCIFFYFMKKRISLKHFRIKFFEKMPNVDMNLFGFKEIIVG